MRLTAQGLTGYGDTEWGAGQPRRGREHKPTLRFPISQPCAFPFLNQQQLHRVKLPLPLSAQHPSRAAPSGTQVTPQSSMGRRCFGPRGQLQCRSGGQTAHMKDCQNVSSPAHAAHPRLKKKGWRRKRLIAPSSSSILLTKEILRAALQSPGCTGHQHPPVQERQWLLEAALG